MVRSVAQLPGITQANDYKSAIYVRGGASDQNQFLLDGIKIYSPNHLLGVLGPFNVLALQDVTVHAAQFPARYGGRLSGLISMDTRTPSDSTYTRANVSLVSASAAYARSLSDLDLLVAARRTYADPLLAVSGAGFWYNFYDTNLKASYPLGRGVSVEAIGFLSRDALTPRLEAGGGFDYELTWGGRVGALRLVQKAGSFQQQLTGSIVREYLNGSFLTDASGGISTRLRSRTLDYRGQWTGTRTRLEVGGALDGRLSNLDWEEASDLQIDEFLYAEAPPVFASRQTQGQASGYALAERHLGTRLTVETGLRYTTVGGASGGEWSPRLRVSYDVSDRATVTATAGRYVQFVGEGAEAREFRIDEPVFLLDTPQTAQTVTLGTTWRPSARYRLGAEVYARRFQDIVRILPGPETDFPAFERLSGEAQGIDVFAKKSAGWLTGQVSYSLIDARLDFADGSAPPDWNVRHTVQGLLGIWLGDYWQFRMAGTWRSGLPYTPAIGQFSAPVFQIDRNVPRYIEGPRNSERLPSYARLDMSLRRTYQADRYTWVLYVQALNVLNRTNVIRTDTRQLYSGTSTRPIPQGLSSSMPVLPSVGIEFQF